MARVLGPPSADRWEREVARQLAAQLPTDWVAISNVSWSMRNEAGYVRDGQSDFVVLAPELGLAIVEVKGSQAVRIGDDGTWYRSEFSRTGTLLKEVQLDESPPEQATRNMHTLAKLVCRELAWPQFPGLYAYVVVYPNGRVTSAPPLYDMSTVVQSRQMGQLAHRIRVALEARGTPAQGRSFSTAVMERAREALTNRNFAVQQVDSALDVGEDEQDIHQLTRQQFAALKGVFDLPRVAVVGPAGSGKTTLAIWRLLALREAGKKAAYVCFNKDLAAVLRINHPEIGDSIESVDRMLARIAAPLPSGHHDTEFFTETLPFLAMDAAMKIAPSDKFDALIVDEGQDFGENRLIALLELLRPESQWVVFADWQQEIYKAGNSGPIGAEVTYRLYHNCRNTVRINEATNKYLRLAVEAMPGMPDGVVPTIAYCSSPTAMARQAWELASAWQPDGGVAILSPYKLQHSCMAKCLKAYGLTLTEDIAQLGAPGYVYFSTIKSFKGIEAPGVVVVDADWPGATKALGEQDLYVAFTRPTARLALLTTSREAHQRFEAVQAVAAGSRASVG